MSGIPPLTLVLGPQTDASLALNAVIRANWRPLSQAGIAALPSRMASPIVRRAVNDRPALDRIEDFAAATEQRPAILSAVNFFGPAHGGMARREMFPDAEILLSRLAEVAPKARIVLSVDNLPAFFLAASSEVLETRVRKTSWETLYELTWADLVQEIKEALPGSEPIVLTPRAAGQFSVQTLQLLFGPVADSLPDPYTLLRGVLTETGKGVLDRLVSKDAATEGTLGELFDTLARRPSDTDIKDRLGIDKVTRALLDQRFEEDVVAMRALPGVQVIG